MAGCTRRLKQRDRSIFKMRSRKSPQTVAGNIQQGKSNEECTGKKFQRTTSNKKLVVTKGIATRSQDATRCSYPEATSRKPTFRLVRLAWFGHVSFRVRSFLELGVSRLCRDVRGGSSRETAAISK